MKYITHFFIWFLVGAGAAVLARFFEGFMIGLTGTEHFTREVWYVVGLTVGVLIKVKESRKKVNKSKPK
jgi:hypothetical protein